MQSMNLESLVFTALLLVSILTGLFTQSIKNVITDKYSKLNSVLIAGIISIVLSILVGIAYMVYYELAVTAQLIIAIIVLAVLSWLCATVGYDKVMQALNPLNKSK